MVPAYDGTMHPANAPSLATFAYNDTACGGSFAATSLDLFWVGYTRAAEERHLKTMEDPNVESSVSSIHKQLR